MADELDKKISELTERTALTGQELVPLAAEGENGSVSTRTLRDYATAGLAEGIAAATSRLDEVEAVAESEATLRERADTKLGARLGEVEEAMTEAQGEIATLGTAMQSVQAAIAEGVGSVKGVQVNGDAVSLPDGDGIVHIDVAPEIEVDEVLNPDSDNPVRNSAIAQAIDDLGASIGAKLRLNQRGEGDEKVYSISLLDSDDEELSTTDEWSGGGGGGGGLATRLVLEKVTPNRSVKVGDTVRLRYRYDQLDSNGNSTGNPAVVTISVAGRTVETWTTTIDAGEEYEIDVTRHIAAGTNKVTVRAVVDDGEARQTTSVQWSIKGVELHLASDFNIATAIRRGEPINLACTLTGGNSSAVKVYVDGVEAQQVTANSNNFHPSFTIDSSGMRHGSHSVQVVAEYPLTASSIIRSNSIYFDVAVREAGETAPVFAARFDYNDGTIIPSGGRPHIAARQYEYYTIDYAVYDPLNEVATVTVYEGGTQVAETSSVFQHTSVRQRAVGNGSVGGSLRCRGTEYTYGINIEASAIDIAEPIPAFRTLNLTALGRGNTDVNRTEWTDGEVTTEMTNILYGSDGWTGTTLRVVNNGKVRVNFSPWKRPAQNATGGTAFVVKYSSSNVLDDDAEIIRCVDTGGRGLVITPTEIRMTTADTAISMRTAPEATYEVAIVTFPETPYSEGAATYEQKNSQMVYLYINGILSGAAQMAGGATAYQSGSPKIEIGSPSATTDVYLMRAYSRYLTDSQVLDCYILDQTNVDDLFDKYAANDILSVTGDISIGSVPDGMRVVIVTGKASNGTPIMLQAAINNDKNAKYNLSAADGEGILTYIKGATDRSRNFSLSGGRVRLQGTSSLAYPIKNYRIYVNGGALTVGCDSNGLDGTASEDGLFSFRRSQDSASGYAAAPVDCWCLKADYAESSSSHNTGMAKLVQNTLVKARELTPAQRHVDRSRYQWDVRTTVDGEPCMVFYRATRTDAPVFLGKYNWNNDKSTEAVFGFCDIPGYHDSIPAGLGNPTECWEFKTNDLPMGCFLDNDFTTTETDSEGNTTPKWLKVFEARFPDDDDLNAAYESGTIPTYLKAIVDWVYSTRDNPQKFRAELGNYFDVNYLCDYYELTDIFGCVDQRVKNMMMGIWYNPDAEDVAPMGKMRAYMIFYDNDTIMGVRNDGRLKYSWDIDENTVDPELSSASRTVYAYAGHDSVLWANLRSQFPNELRQAYIRLRAQMSNSDIFNMFDVEQSSKFPERVYNLDAMVKYIEPKTIGIRVVDEGEEKTKQYSYLESMQGSRLSHRHWWLNNRLNLFDAWAATGGYPMAEITWKGATAAGARVSATSMRDYYFQMLSENTVVDHSRVRQGDAWSYTNEVAPNAGTVFHLRGVDYMQSIDLSGWGGMTDLALPALPRVEELVLGLQTSGRSYPLTELSLGTKAPLLKRFVMQNYMAMSSVNLGGCEKLEYLDLSGCASLASVTIAQNAPLAAYTTPEGLSTLSLRYMPEISNAGLTISNIGALQNVAIVGCPQLDTVALVQAWMAAVSRAESVTLQDVDWELPSAQLLLEIAAKVGQVNITGDVHISAIMEDEIQQLRHAYGDAAFDSPTAALRITYGVVAIATTATNPELVAWLHGKWPALFPNADYVTSAQAAAANTSNANGVLTGEGMADYGVRTFPEFRYFTGFTALSEVSFKSCMLEELVFPPSFTTLTTQHPGMKVRRLTINGTNLQLRPSGYIFYQNPYIEEVTIYSATEIPARQFMSMSALRSLTFGPQVTTIGDRQTQDSHALRRVVSLAMTAPACTSPTFGNAASNVTAEKLLLVPEGATGYDQGEWKALQDTNGFTLQTIITD